VFENDQTLQSFHKTHIAIGSKSKYPSRHTGNAMNLGVIWENSIKYSISHMASMSVYTNRRKILLGAMTAGVAAILIGGITAYQTSIAQNNNDNNDSPTDGFDIHVTVNKHDSENLDHDMNHYCKLDDKIVAVCLLFDGHDTNANLAQVEFIITDQQYQQLPEREKFNWHNHAVELTPERGEPQIVSLPEGVEGASLLDTLKHTYGKVVTLWDPNDNVPDFPPYVFAVDSPHALGQDENDDLECEWPEAGKEIPDSCGEDED